MPTLRSTLERHGFADVRTHLQSGNVVLRSKLRSETKLAATVAELLAADLDVQCPVVVRTPAQLDAVIAANPFADRLAAATGTKAMHVTFLDRSPAPEAFADLDAGRYAPDELVAAGREVYLWCAGGYGRTKLTPALLERRTGCNATDRNWNTVLALAALTRG